MYNFKETEKKWREFWEKENVYRFDPKSKKKIYSVDTPPPTLSGRMHIGHTSSYSQQDFIIRYKKMKGFEIFYPFGTDDNGLPTERLVEKSKNIKSKDMSRAEFVKLCMAFIKEERPKFIQDWKNLGISCDWNLIYSTIEDESRRISQWSFLDLYKKGRMERKDAPAMWCPECKTGVAQFELQDKQADSSFNDLTFEIQKEKATIATTRPELLPACVAVFYHPNDKRYKKYKGKTAKVPLFNFEVPVMEDKRVDETKGTGLVMCCTFGDQTDMEWQKAYNLPIKIAISPEGKMTEIAGKYSGMPIKAARKEIIQDLKNAKLLTKETPIQHIVNVHDRCGTPIEFVKSKQWFVKYLDLKQDMIKWGEQLNWYPEFMRHRYDNWVNGLQWDWLISNQRHFGVSLPVWYCKKCQKEMIAQEKQLPVDPSKDKPLIACRCGSNEFVPDTDVLNTWFTSSMTPMIVNNLVKDESAKKRIFPMSLRPQAHDIISFWLFNTMVKSHLHQNKNPWEDTIISGFVTLKGEKMSKSKGNTINPQEVIESHGVDAVRYWAASSKLGEDFDYNEKDVLTGKKFVNKLFNAANFVFMNLKHQAKKPELLETDRIFLSELNELIKSVTSAFDSYNFSRAKSETDNFFWKNFTDNYLEIVKNRVYNGTEKEKASAFYTLYTALLVFIKLFAPITPYITEEIYQNHFRKYEKEKSIHLCSWPEKIDVKDNGDDDEKWQKIVEIISKVRQEKTRAQKPMNSAIKFTLDKKTMKFLKDCLQDIQSVTNSSEIKEGEFQVKF